MDRYTEWLRVAVERGEPLDVSLAALRQQGASLIEAIKAVREVKSVSLSEAKRLVDESAAQTGEMRRPIHERASWPSSTAPNAGFRLFTLRDKLWLAVVVLVVAAAAWIQSRVEFHVGQMQQKVDGQQRRIEELVKENERLQKQLELDQKPAD